MIHIVIIITAFLEVLYVNHVLDLAVESGNTDETLISVWRTIVIEWFTDRNVFGILLSLAMTVIFLPSLILCILIEIIPKLSKLPKFIWRLGYKKSSWRK